MSGKNRDKVRRGLSLGLMREPPLQSSHELSALIPKLESALKELREIKA